MESDESVLKEHGMEKVDTIEKADVSVGYMKLGEYSALVPVVLFIPVLALLASSNFEWAGHSPQVLTALNALFLSIVPLLASYYAARAYLESGSPTILPLGCGLLVLSLTSFTTGYISGGQGGVNDAVTVYNTGFMISSIFHLAASIISLSGSERLNKGLLSSTHRGFHVFSFYGVSIALVCAVTYVAVSDMTPVFFVQGEGPTWLRQVVLSSSVTFFLASSFAFMQISFRIRSSFPYWYSLALLLIAQGLGTLLFMQALGSPLNWAGRAFQYLGGIYFLIGVVKAFKEARARGLSIEKTFQSLVDVAELERAKDALRKSEDTVRAQLDEIEAVYRSAPVGMCVLDRELRFLRINDRLAGINGIPAKDHLGKTVREIVPDLADLAEEIAERIFRTGLPELNVEFSGATESRPGVVRHFVEQWLPLKDLSGSVFGINVVAEDVTEQKGLIEELRESRERFRTLADNIPDVVARYDRDLRHIYVNPAVQQYVEFSMEEYIGKTNEELGFSEKQTTVWNRVFREVLETGRPAVAEFQLNARGSQRYFQIQVAPEMADGEVKSLISVSRDITERRRMEEELRKSHEELEARVRERTAELSVTNKALVDHAAKLQRLNDELQEFAFIASHDLQEPLRKIQTFGSILAQSYRDSLGEEGRDHLTRIMKSAKRMSDLLRSLLDYSRIVTRENPYETTDLRTIIEDAVSGLEPAIESRGAKVEVGELPVIEADAPQLRQLFQNLISNSIKYCSDCESPLVRISGSTDREMCQVLVHDNGIGFDQEYIDKIFRPFQRLHGRKAPYEGTGMGLTLCRKIVERHGGSITALSTAGQGSTFIVNLPRKQNNRGNI